MTTAPAPPDLLRTIGEALFGPRWQTDMAQALNVSDRTVRHWLSERQHPREGVWHDLDQLLEARIARQRQAQTQLHAHLRNSPSPGT